VACRDFLQTMWEMRHWLVMSDELNREWRDHGSRFALLWLGAMKDRGRLEMVGLVRDADLRQSLGQAARDQAQRDRMFHDAHLVETARRADRLVCSRDESVRTDFSDCAPSVTQLGGIVWVNPTHPHEEPLAWLRAGARNDPHRRLDNSGS
jgi:hypothetical protein